MSILVIVSVIVFVIALKYVPRNVLEARDEEFLINEGVMSELNEKWRGSPEKEFGACLVFDNNTITGLEDVRTNGGEGELEWLETCPTNTFEIHSHPTKNCNLSGQDGAYFHYRKVTDGVSYQAVMCGKNRIAIYGIDNLRNPYKLVVA